MSKKLQEKQRRRLAEEKKRAEMKRAARRRNLVTLVIAIIVTIGVVWLILDESTGGSDGPKGGPFGVSKADAGCEDIQSAKPQKAEHIAVGSEHEPYNTNPPTSGPHYAAPTAPIATGFYSDEIEPEKVVHNLEHGMIVIWYDPNAPDSTITAVERAVDEVPDATVAVPWDNIDDGKHVVLTAWAHLQNCSDMSKDVLDAFREQFQGKGPENVGIKTFEAS